MNINELNRIRTINVEEKVANVEAGTGTYREIHDKVMANEIIPIINGCGNIVGISYDSKVTNLIDDNIAQVAFEKRYRGKDVMRYVMTALRLKATNADIADIQEDADGIRVILASGEVVSVYEAYHAPVREVAPRIELPSEVELTVHDLDVDCINEVTIADVKKYLRDTYDHYLSGNYSDPDLEVDEDAQVIKVTNIHWGRKR